MTAGTVCPLILLAAVEIDKAPFNAAAAVAESVFHPSAVPGSHASKDKMAARRRGGESVTFNYV